MFNIEKPMDSGFQALLQLNTRNLHKQFNSTRANWFSIFFASCVFAIVLVWAVLRLGKSKEDVPEGCWKLGLQTKSNLADQYDPKYARAIDIRAGSQGPVVGRVKGLFIHPVKSCAPLELGEGTVIAEGMEYDRHFAFAIRTLSQKSEAGKPQSEYGPWAFLTQRAKAKLARVMVDMWIPQANSPSSISREKWADNGGCIVISFPQPNVSAFDLLLHRLSNLDPSAIPMHTVTLPWQPSAHNIKRHSLTLENMRIWDDNPLSLNVTNMIPPHIMDDLKSFVGIADEVQLALFRVHKKRDILRDAPSAEVAGYQPRTGFQDGYPLHLNNLASIRDVASRLPKGFGALTAMRYRANFLITGPAPYAEDNWKRIRIGAAEYYVASCNPRCPLPNVDPATGVAPRLGTPMYNQPLKTLRTYRVIDPGSKSPMLGMNLVPVSPDPQPIRVGDEVEVLETGSHCYTGMLTQ